jgi:hypothetical protein
LRGVFPVDSLEPGLDSSSVLFGERFAQILLNTLAQPVQLTRSRRHE